MLTTASLHKFKSTTQPREISDGQSGLRLLVHPIWHDKKGKPRAGTKAWIMRFRRDGKPAKLTLGRVHLLEANEEEPNSEPIIGGLLTLRAARRLAAQISQQRAQGIDVIGTYATQKSRERSRAEEAAANTFTGLALEFVRDHKVRRWGTRPRRWRGDAAILGLRWPTDCDDPSQIEPEVIKGSLADSWRDKPLANVDSHDIYTVLIDAKKRGISGLERRNRNESDNRARKMRGALSVFFKWAEEHRKITTNPCLGGWKPRSPAARERTMNDTEILAFWSATETVAEPVRSLLKVLVLTGQRVNEVRGMRYDELSPEGVWTIPSDRTKNHRPHQLSLSPMLRDIIASVPVIEGSKFVFVGATGMTPVTLGSKVKATLDGTMGEVPAWRFHDLRRTVASGLQRLGVRSEVIERLLNHVSGVFGGVAGIYQRDPLSDEVTAALLRWSQHVHGLVEGDDKVVPIREGKR
jgi:integrase